MLGITFFACAIYFLIGKQFNIAIPSLIIAVVFSKYTTGYYCLGLECLLDSDSDCSGQLILATDLYSSQYLFSDSLGVSPPL